MKIPSSLFGAVSDIANRLEITSCATKDFNRMTGEYERMKLYNDVVLACTLLTRRMMPCHATQQRMCGLAG